MKKLILYGLSSILLVSMITPVLAIGPVEPPVKEQELSAWLDIVVRVTKWIYSALLVLAVVFVLIAAFTYLTAAGDPTKVKKASTQLIFAVVAIVVAILAFSIERIVTGVVK